MLDTFNSLKQLIKRRAPWLVPIYSHLVWERFIRPRWRQLGMKVFEEHYHNGGWGCSESASGHGSTLASTVVVRSILPKIVEELNIQSILDIPCGDFNWMQMVDLKIPYIGADIVSDLIAVNQRNYGNEFRSFVRLDLTVDPLPPVDLILTRDCLFHFSFRDVTRAIANIKRSPARYLLATTNPGIVHNRDIVTGEWRSLNLQIFPASLPKPLRLIREATSVDPHPDDKYLGLWQLDQIRGE